MKVKKILNNTTSRHEYNMAHLFDLDVWNRREMNRLRRKYYGGYENNMRRPNWKLQKIKKQWMVQPWKETHSYGLRGRIYITIKI